MIFILIILLSMWTMGKKTAWWKKKTFILGILLLWVGTYITYIYFFDTSNIAEEENYIYTGSPVMVRTWDISEEISFDGTTAFHNAQKLTFGKNGLKVKSVNVKVWDTVKKNQVLASLQTSSLDERLQSAQISLKQAKNNYEKLLSNTNNELDLLKAQSDLQTAKSNLTNIESTILLANNEEDTKIEQTQKDYDDAIEDYNEILKETENGINDSERKHKNSYTTAIDDLKDDYIDIQNSLDDIDKIMFYTNDFGQEWSATIYIGAKDSSLRNETKENFYDITTKNKELEAIYTTLSQQNNTEWVSQSEIEEAYKKVTALWIALMDLWETASDMFNASVTSVDLSQNTIDNYVKISNTIYTQGRKLKDQATNTMDNIYNLDEDSEDDSTQAKEKMDNLKLTLDNLLLKKANREASNQEIRVKAQEAVENAEQEVENIEEGYNNLSLENAKDSITKTQTSINSILQDYEDYQLIANFDGTVTEMDIQIGDTISNDNSDDTYIYVEDPNLIEIELNIEQTDILKLKVGDPVSITIDVFEGQIFTWEFSEISTVPTTSNGESTYKATVIFNKPEKINILGGMTTTVTVITSEVKDVVLVANSSLTVENWKYYVTKEDGTRQEVQIGSSDDENTEIISWISAGESILGLSITQKDLTTSWISEDHADSWGFGPWRWPWGWQGGWNQWNKNSWKK